MTDREKLYNLFQDINCPNIFMCNAHELQLAEYLVANGVTFAKDTDVPSKWVSVEDRLPHAEYGESDNVLAVDGHGIVEMLYFDGGCWCYPTGEPVFCEDPSWRITHWMSMPEPPRVQEVPNGTDHI